MKPTIKKFNNHVPPKLLVLVGSLLVLAGISFGYYIAQYDDLLQAPVPVEQFDIQRASNTPISATVPDSGKKCDTSALSAKAKNIKAGEIKTFVNVCDIPQSWTILEYTGGE